MKHKLISAFALLLLLAIAVKVYADSYSVTVNNNSSETIGNVVINLSDNTHPPLYVGGSGQYGMPLLAQPVSVTINGYTVNAGASGNVTLGNSPVIHVTVSNPDAGITILVNDAGS